VLVSIVLTARGRDRLKLGGFLAMFVAVGVLLLAATPSGARLTTKVTHGDSSGRTDLWHVALNMVRAHPVTGVGLGNYPAVSRHYLDSTVVHAELFTQFPRVVHDTPLEILAELGLIGALLYYTFVGSALLIAWRGLHQARRLRDGELVSLGRGILAAEFAALSACVFLSGQYAEVLWVLLGVGVAYGTIATRAGRAQSPPHSPI